jgi:hypothetical protein
MKISEKYLNLIMAKLAEADIIDFSDEEIERAFEHTVMPNKLIQLTKKARDNGIIQLYPKNNSMEKEIIFQNCKSSKELAGLFTACKVPMIEMERQIDALIKETLKIHIQEECEHPFDSVLGDGEMQPAKCLKCGKILSS